MIIDRETCIGCGECVFTCTVDAIRLHGRQGRDRPGGLCGMRQLPEGGRMPDGRPSAGRAGLAPSRAQVLQRQPVQVARGDALHHRVRPGDRGVQDQRPDGKIPARRGRGHGGARPAQYGDLSAQRGADHPDADPGGGRDGGKLPHDGPDRRQAKGSPQGGASGRTGPVVHRRGEGQTGATWKRPFPCCRRSLRSWTRYSAWGW